jgi:hypothetical protein
MSEPHTILAPFPVGFTKRARKLLAAWDERIRRIRVENKAALSFEGDYVPILVAQCHVLFPKIGRAARLRLVNECVEFVLKIEKQSGLLDEPKGNA